MMYTIVLVILLVLVVIALCASRAEGFSKSGMSLSDNDCRELAEVYYKPWENNPKCRDNYKQRICGHQRRDTIDVNTGNYFTNNGILI
jgi:hypothetical protein